MERRTIAALLALLLTSPAADAKVFVVSPMSLVYPEIQFAIEAAADGDTILIKSGTYTSFYLDKELVLAAEAGATVDVLPIFQPYVVGNLPAGKTVVIRGIDGPMIVHSCAGVVRFEDCTMTGQPGFCFVSPPLPAQWWDPGPGAELVDSPLVQFVRCTITGGMGPAPTPLAPCCTNGGVGLTMQNSPPVLYDTIVSGGSANTILACTDGPAFSGGPVLVFNGVDDFVATSPLRQGQPGSLDFAGVPGDAIVLLASASADELAAPPHTGRVLLGAPIVAVALGTIPPGGVLSFPFVITNLPPAGVDAVTMHLQPAYVAPNGKAAIGPASVLTLLDPMF